MKKKFQLCNSNDIFEVQSEDSLFSVNNFIEENSLFKQNDHESGKDSSPIKKQVKFKLIKAGASGNSFLQKKKISTRKRKNLTNTPLNGRWDREEHRRFCEAILKFSNDWKKIQEYVSTRSGTQIRSHAQKFLIKLKENKFLVDKGLSPSMSWSKSMNFLKNNLTFDELKNALYSPSLKKINWNKYKTVKKSGEFLSNSTSLNESSDNFNKKKEINNKESSSFTISPSRSVFKYSDICAPSFLGIEEDYFQNQYKKEEQEKEKIFLEKFVRSFNSTPNEVVLNDSFDFEEISQNLNMDENFLGILK